MWAGSRARSAWRSPALALPVRAEGTPALYGLLRDNLNTWRAHNGKKEWKNWERVIKIVKSGIIDANTVWHTTEFRFADAVIDDIDEILSSYGEMTVGKWGDYIDTDTLGGATGGLRVATHGQLTKKTNKSTSGTETDPTIPQGTMTATGGRQSHHVTKRSTG